MAINEDGLEALENLSAHFAERKRRASIRLAQSVEKQWNFALLGMRTNVERFSFSRIGELRKVIEPPGEIELAGALIILIGCGNSSSSTSSKEVKILQEQKDASEHVTLRAVELIKEDRMTEVRQLYKNRWNELATLRTNIVFDSDLNTAEKQNIEEVLRGEQEGITEILAKYERLYGP